MKFFIRELEVESQSNARQGVQVKGLAVLAFQSSQR